MINSRTPIIFKYLRLTLGLSVLALILLYVITTQVFETSLVKDEVHHIQSYSMRLSESLLDGLLTNNIHYLRNIIQEHETEDILWTSLFDEQGNRLLLEYKFNLLGQDFQRSFPHTLNTHSGLLRKSTQTAVVGKNDEQQVYILTLPVHAKSDTITWGYVNVGYSLTQTYQTISHFRWAMLFALIGLGIAGTLIFTLALKKYLSPVKDLQRAALRVARGDYSARVDISSEDELADLSVAFNHMGEEIQSTKEEIESWADTLEREVEKRTRELQESEEFNRKLVETSPDAIIVYQDNQIQFINRAGVTMLGAKSPHALLGTDFLDKVHPDDRPKVQERLGNKQAWQKADPFIQVRIICGDRSSIDVELAATPLLYKNQSAMQILARDISDRKALEEQLLQSQKMESIGTLAGGMAHDFNNILTSISGYISLLKMKIPKDESLEKYIETIESSARKATDLTNKLLGFARGGKYEPEVIDPYVLLEETRHLLGGLLSQNITIEIETQDISWNIYADKNQIEQSLLNLCLNAKEAMPDGGTLTLSIDSVQLSDNSTQKYSDLESGDYVKFSVSDTGVGIEKDLQSRIFEPFYTTKDKGRGTGLGLSMVYGIVSNHKGGIHLTSAPNRGSTFEILLPATDKQPQTTEILTEKPTIPENRSILVVDDEQYIRDIFQEMFRNYNNTVYLAENGKEAIQKFKHHKDEIEIVILDLLMPGMQGTEVFHRLQEINPDVPVIICSGYSQESDVTDLLESGAIGFIRKPVNFSQLANLMSKSINVTSGD